MERKDAVLNDGFIAWSGLISYSLYLWQQPFLTLAGPADTILVRLPLTFAAAYLSYCFVERPVLRMTAFARRSRFSRGDAAVVQES
jgi:peptidoglycan/LPS O-acetylase OafA/YrhL